MLREVRRLFAPGMGRFRAHALRDLFRFVSKSVAPVHGESAKRARAAANWLLHAQRVNSDGGISLGYFPCSPDGVRWKPSYPETTGYAITSLLAFASRYADTDVRGAALRMAAWETAVQMDSGAVQGGTVRSPKEQTAAAFNTGMVLDGWCSVYEFNGDPQVLDAARGAADWLVADLDNDGYFRTNGAFVSSGEVKTYTCLCAWALYRFGLIAADVKYTKAAIACVEGALRQQQPNGWFAHNCLVRSEAPLTHTIGYTLQGILEVGVLAKRQDFVDAVRNAIAGIAPSISPRGFLPGLFYADWEPAQLSSCLTGSAQIAIVCYRLYEETSELHYREWGDRLLDYLKSLQAIGTPMEEINGALSGSFPLFGQYMRGGYPNWATKYLLDALLLQERTRDPNALEPR